MPYYGDGSNLTGVVDTGSRDDIALLAFKTQANGNLARYNLVDQSVDSFEDATGVDASGSTDEQRDASGKYYSGVAVVAGATVAFTTIETTSWTAPTGVTSVDYLVVAGGASGGSGDAHNYGGGGGGAGGILTGTHTVVPSTSYTVTVGAGGAAIPPAATTGGAVGNDGSDSVFNSFTPDVGAL